jgi:DNA-binding PadR family transcriptional regulator
MSSDLNFLKENIDLIILNALYVGDKYGYDISREILEKTDSQYEIKQPTLYSYLKRLENRHLITSYWGTESNGGRRRYYKLTEGGRKFCEYTSSIWHGRKAAMDSIVIDGVDDVEDAEQAAEILSDITNFDDVKRPKRRQRDISVGSVAQQLELSRELDKLSQQTAETLTTETSTVSTIIADAYPEKTEDEKENAEPVVEEKPQAEPVETPDVAVEKVQENHIPAPETPAPPLSDSRIENFEVVQDNVEVFIQKFDKAAEEIAVQSDVVENDDYRRTLNSILSDQLDAMQKFNTEQPAPSDYTFVSDRPLALEEVANTLAKDGIRMRIYNSTSATYRTKELFPIRKVYSLTAWLASLSVIALLLILMASTLSAGVWKAFVVTSAVLLAIPIIFTVISIADPARKDKPKINFGSLYLGTSITALVIILLCFGINILFSLLVFSDIGAVVTQIGIPSILALILPLSVLYLDLLFKNFSK